MRIYDRKTKVVKTIATLLSIILLFFNWVVTCGRFEYNWSEYQYVVTDVFDMIETFVYWSGNEVDTTGIQKAIDCVLDGELSATEMSTVAFEISKFFAQTEVADDSSELQSVKMCAWIYFFVFWSVIITAGIMLYCLWKRECATLEKGFFIAQIALLGEIGILCLAIYGEMGEWMIRPTLFAVFAVLCAVPTGILQKLPIYNTTVLDWNALQRNIDKEKSFAVVCGEKWECGSCGQKNMMNAKFCSNCGRKKPEKVNCMNCGFEIQDNDVFCKKCGTKLQEKRSICSNCGSSIGADSDFCEYCGQKIK